jgi:hypothetical protein
VTAIAAGVVAVLAGILFAALGLLAAAETVRHRRRRSARALGATFFLLAAVYAPLQLTTGVRLVVGDVGLAGSVLFSQVGALLPLAVFAGLRLEALTGARAERTVHAVPVTVSIVPALAAFVGGGIAWGALITPDRPRLGPELLALAALLLAVGALVGLLIAAAQEGRRRERGGWSLSALSFAAIFPAAGYAQAMAVIAQPPAGAALWLHVAALPASLVLLFVVRRLYNRARWASPEPLVGRAARSVRSSPWRPAPR